MRKLQMLEPPKSILLIRTSAIGDVVMASPIVEALHRTYPDAHIAWVVEPGIHELLSADPCVDEVILWPKNEWRTLWKEGHLLGLMQRVLAFRAQLRAHRFDMVLDLQGLLKSGFLAWLSGAPVRIGLGSKEGSRLLMTKVFPRGGDTERISSEYFFLAQKLGLSCGEFLPRLLVDPEAEQRVFSLLSSRGIQPAGYAVFAPFTTRPQKHWIEEYWLELASLLIERTGLTPVILGGPADVAAANRMVSADMRITGLAGATRIAEAVAIIKHAALVVGVDTGLSHMGIALNRPTVAIFGSTCPYLNTCRANARVIWLGKECSPCRRHPVCDGAFPCLKEITPRHVLEVAVEMMEKTA